MLKLFLFCCLTTLSINTFAQISKEAFSQLRNDISAENRKSPLAGIKKVDEILTKFNAELANYQRIRLLYLKSYFQINADRIEEALSTLSQTRVLAKEITEPGILYSYYGISASAFKYVELHDLALENYMKAYKEAPLLNKPQFILQTENNIGDTYLTLGLIEKAEYYFKRFYDSAVEMNLPSHRGIGLNNLGEVAYYKDDFDEAEKLHLEALALRKKHGYEYHQSWSMYNLGRVYFAKKELEKAEHFLTLSIKRYNNQNALTNALFPKLELAKLFRSKNLLRKAKTLLDEVIFISKEYKKFSTMKDALSERASLNRQENNLQAALEDMDEYNLVMQKIAERKSSIGMAYVISETELQTKEMALKQLEQEHVLAVSLAESEKKIGLTLLISFMLLITITWFFLFRLNRKKGQLQNLVTRLQSTQGKLVESEKMRAMTTLVSGMAHQLNTPLGLVITANSSLQSQVQILAHKLNDKSLTQSQLSHFLDKSNELLTLSQGNSEKAAEMIETFKMMSAKLEMCERKDFEVIEFLNETVPKIIRTHNKSIDYQISGKEIMISSYPSIFLKIINQFIENSVLHGFVLIEKPIIKVDIKINSHEIEIHYSDNGVGIEPDKKLKIFDPFYTTRLNDGSLGLGLNIIYNSVVHLMDGQVECVSKSEGAYFIIVIPKINTNKRIDHLP